MKFLDEAQGTAVTRRRIEGTNDDGDLADLLLQAFEGEAVSKTEEMMRFIGCNFTASKLREDYPKSKYWSRGLIYYYIMVGVRR